MSAQYTAQQIADIDNGWLVIETATEKKYVVFCNANANTAQDAVDLITEPPSGDD